LKDLIYVEEQKTWKEEIMVNWTKNSKITEILSIFHLCQNIKYKHNVKHNKIFNYFFHLYGFDRNLMIDYHETPLPNHIKANGELPKKPISYLGCNFGK
jgi:hypothetical protein